MSSMKNMADDSGMSPQDLYAADLVGELLANVRVRNREEWAQFMTAMIGTMGLIVDRAEESIRLGKDLKKRISFDAKLPPKPVHILAEVATEAAVLAESLASLAMLATTTAFATSEDINIWSDEDVMAAWSAGVREMILHGVERIGLSPPPVPVSAGLGRARSKGRRLAESLKPRS